MTKIIRINMEVGDEMGLARNYKGKVADFNFRLVVRYAKNRN